APRRSRARRSGARRRAACRYRVAAWPFAGGARSHGRGAAGFGGDAASGRLRATGSDDPDAGAGGSRPARARRRAGDGGRRRVSAAARAAGATLSRAAKPVGRRPDARRLSRRATPGRAARLPRGRRRCSARAGPAGRHRLLGWQVFALSSPDGARRALAGGPRRGEGEGGGPAARDRPVGPACAERSPLGIGGSDAGLSAGGSRRKEPRRSTFALPPDSTMGRGGVYSCLSISAPYIVVLER